jgi:cytochrome oxidase Cu insertion factor (SCO1/SenC/PrrC family)
MPNGEIADLGSSLARLLLWCAVWSIAGAVLVGAGYGLMRRRSPEPRDAIAEPRARRYLRIALGSLWIVDGLLQAQPRMPAGFVPAEMNPRVQSAPQWYGSLVAPLLRAWTRHPVAADAAVVVVEIGVGVLFLVAAGGLLARVAAWAGISLALLIWALGEAFGGLLVAGASWLTGAPGAALGYALVAALLLAPATWWHSGRANLLLRRGVAGWLLIGAVLESLPGEGFWHSAGLSMPFADGASQPQPDWLVAPIRSLADTAGRSPVAVNAVIVVLVVAVAVWLWFDARTGAVCAAIVLCLATWWLAQDLGILGGTATDPDAGLPLALVIAAALPAWSRRADLSPTRSAVGDGARVGVVALALGLVVVIPTVLAVGLAGPADSAAVAADSAGGLRTIPPRPAPGFALIDQHRRPLSLAGLRGKVVLLTFLDPVCSSDCPLIANQLAIADRRLGALARQVEIVAIDSNPLFPDVADVAAFTDSHGLGGLANWHFLCGPADSAQAALAEYGITVDIPAVGMIEHSEGLFFIRPDGTEAAYLDDGAAEQLTETYAQQVEKQLRRMLQ